MTATVLVSTSSFGRADRAPLARLEAAGFDVRLNPHGRRLERPETVELLAGVSGLVAGTETLDREVLAGASELRVISRCGAGLDGVDLEAAAELGIEVFHTPDALTDAVAELTLAGMLAVARRLGEAERSLRRGEWVKPTGRLLAGKTVGIVGLGRIGRRVAELLAPFRVRLIAHDPAPDRAAAERLGVELLELETLFTLADLVTLHLPLGAQTRHLVDRERLASMRPGAMLVNCARGGLVDEAALAEALVEGRLGGVYLDVFEEEPYQGPLTEAPNAVLTPHIGSYAAEARARMESEAAENLLRFFGGETA